MDAKNETLYNFFLMVKTLGGFALLTLPRYTHLGVKAGLKAKYSQMENNPKHYPK